MVTRLDRLARRPATCRTPSPLSPTRKRIVPRSGSTGRSPWQVGKPTIPRVGLARLEPRRAAARCYKQWLAHPILTFRFFNRQRQRFVLLVLTVRCCRSLPPRCYVTVLCFSNTVLQLCLAVSHVCLCGRRHLSRQSGPRFNQKDRLLKRRGEKPGLHRTARAGNSDRSCGLWLLSKHTQTPKCSPLELTQNLRPSSSTQAQYPASF